MDDWEGEYNAILLVECADIDLNVEVCEIWDWIELPVDAEVRFEEVFTLDGNTAVYIDVDRVDMLDCFRELDVIDLFVDAWVGIANDFELVMDETGFESVVNCPWDTEIVTGLGCGSESQY